MPGRPQDKIKRIADLVAWHKELAADFDKLLPPMYRFNGVADTGDARRDAWANADRCVVMTGAALVELEDALRDHAKLPAMDEHHEPEAEVSGEVAEPNSTETE